MAGQLDVQELLNRVYDAATTSLKTDAVVSVASLDTELPAAAALTDATANPTTTSVGVFNESYNGTTWDKLRNNVDSQVLASAARTTTQTGADTTNYNGRGLHLIVDVTNAGTGSITAKVQGKSATGIYYDILVGLAITSVGTNVYKIFPGITAAANATASDILPRTFRIVVTANNANSVTYSVDTSVVV